MRAVVVVLLVLLLGAGGGLVPSSEPVAWSAPAVGDDDDDGEFDEDGDSLDAFVEETIEAANDFWESRFKERGKQYRAPNVVKAAYNQRVRSQCGNSREAEHSYCAWDVTVFLDWDSDSETSFEALWEADRAFVIVTTIGHEWGHHVQHLLGVFDLDDRAVEVENQADCLMGIFAAEYAKSSDWVTRADLRDAIEDTREAGDDPDTPTVERTHGTPDERVAAFRRGYQARSMRACGL